MLIVDFSSHFLLKSLQISLYHKLRSIVTCNLLFSGTLGFTSLHVAYSLLWKCPNFKLELLFSLPFRILIDHHHFSKLFYTKLFHAMMVMYHKQPILNFFKLMKSSWVIEHLVYFDLIWSKMNISLNSFLDIILIWSKMKIAQDCPFLLVHSNIAQSLHCITYQSSFQHLTNST